MKGKLHIKFEIIKNLANYITKTDLLINNSHKSLSSIQLNEIIAHIIPLCKQEFNIKNYILFVKAIEQKNITSCDLLNNIGYDILFANQNNDTLNILQQNFNATPTNQQLATIAGMFFNLAYEKALKLHVTFHYHGACVAYNLHILYAIFNKIEDCKSLSNKHLKEAIRLFPNIKNHAFIFNASDNDFFYYINKFNTLNPIDFIKQHSNFNSNNTQNGNLIVISNEFQSKYDYIDRIFELYKEAILTANFTKIKLYEPKIHTAIKMLDAVIKTAGEHHIHYHNSCADILQNSAICDIIYGQYELALSKLTKAREFEKSNPKNSNFDKLIESTLLCLNSEIAA